MPTVTPDTVFVVEVPAVVAVISQSPAVRDMLVPSPKVLLVGNVTLLTVDEMYSPTPPAEALSFVVVPTMPDVVGLKVMFPAVNACPQLSASPEVVALASDVILLLLALRLPPIVAAPMLGVTSVGLVARTAFPVPVCVTETICLLPSRAKDVDAVRPLSVVVPENVLLPLNVCVALARAMSELAPASGKLYVRSAVGLVAVIIVLCVAPVI